MNTLLITLVIVAVIWYKWGSNILSIIRILRHKDFSKNPSPTSLSDEQQQALAVGQIINEQNMFYTDTLATGANKSEQKKRLGSAWSVNSHATALACLESFANAGVHQLYNAAIAVYKEQPESEWKSFIYNQYDTDIADDIYEYTVSIKTVLTFLHEKNTMTEQETDEVLKRGAIAWDLGRIVYIARASYTLGYINEQEAWDAINATLPQVKQSFSSWKEFGQSYMLGRAIWSVDDMSIDGLNDIYLDSIQKQESPWVKYPL